MSVDVKYNGAKFPDPQPIVAIGDSPALLDGKVDYSALSIDVIGRITGDGLTKLETEKKYLVTGLSNSFKTLEIGSGSYEFAQPTNLVFQDSNLSTVLPYSVTFLVKEDLPNNGDTTLYTGLADLRDSWSFEEQENSIVEATHTVSAKGLKVSSIDPLYAARHFVTGRINNHLGDTNNAKFVNFSAFLTGQSGFLIARDEEVNRMNSVYSIKDTYRYSLSEEDPSPSGVLSTNTRIAWTKDGGLNVILDGSLQGGLVAYGHPIVSTGSFTTDDAKYFAQKAVERSKSDFEEDSYGAVLQKPRSFNYDVDTGANRLGFSFDFADPSDPRTSEVKHSFTTTVNATKDSNVVSVDVAGNLIYEGTEKLFDNSAPEASARFEAVSGEFDKIDFFGLAVAGYEQFTDNIQSYAVDQSINLSPRNFNVTKNPFNSEISYNYVFDNNIDLSTGALDNPTFTINKNYSIQVHSAQPTIGNSFVVQTGHNTIPSLSLSANANVKTGESVTSALTFFSGVIEENIRKYAFNDSGIIVRSDFATGDTQISITQDIIYQI